MRESAFIKTPPITTLPSATNVRVEIIAEGCMAPQYLASMLKESFFLVRLFPMERISSSEEKSKGPGKLNFEKSQNCFARSSSKTPATVLPQHSNISAITL